MIELTSPNSADVVTGGWEHVMKECTTENDAKRIADITTSMAKKGIEFASILRVPQYEEGRPEDNARHSFMLALAALALAQFRPELDSGLVAQFALVHDLTELQTGDTATFAISDSDLRQKKQREHEALETVCETLPPPIAELLRRYEKQEEPEAVFVRLIDKLLPVAVDIVSGTGSRVMQEAYNVHTDKELEQAQRKLKQRYGRMFSQPEYTSILEAYTLLTKTFASRFTPDPQYIPQTHPAHGEVQEVLF